MLTVALLVLGLAGLLVTGTGLAGQVLPRRFSAAQQRQIVAWEMGNRWRAWAAGTIFPAQVRYWLPGLLLGGRGLVLEASRAGIARRTGCRAATDPSVGRVLAEHGCLAVLRATYDDATHSLAVTVGVAVLPGPPAAQAVSDALPAGHKPRPGVRALPLHGTVVSRFGDRQRQLAWHTPAGPYLVFITTGYADGRRRVVEAADPYAKGEMRSLGRGIAHWVKSHLGATPPAPHCPGGPAC